MATQHSSTGYMVVPSLEKNVAVKGSTVQVRSTGTIFPKDPVEALTSNSAVHVSFGPLLLACSAAQAIALGEALIEAARHYKQEVGAAFEAKSSSPNAVGHYIAMAAEAQAVHA